MELATIAPRRSIISRSRFQYDGLDVELFLCSEVLKLASLHYGYWHPNARLTLGNLRKAQDRYTKTLLPLIPAKVRTVLDVGCGVGDIARTLVSRGYVVMALSPDRNHQKYFSDCPANLSFIPTSFEAFSSSERYDLILMSESQNYFDPDVGFEQCCRYLQPGGYLLVSGMFRREATREFQDAINVEPEYLHRASMHGFRLLKYIDITKRVLPTLVLIRHAWEQYIQPAVAFTNTAIASTPIKATLLRWLLSRQINTVCQFLRYYQERTDPSLFEQKCRYLRLLFQL